FRSRDPAEWVLGFGLGPGLGGRRGVGASVSVRHGGGNRAFPGRSCFLLLLDAQRRQALAPFDPGGGGECGQAQQEDAACLRDDKETGKKRTWKGDPSGSLEKDTARHGLG
ncbi:hypothetical protein Vafri_2971, partial [Volvox africanus]